MKKVLVHLLKMVVLVTVLLLVGFAVSEITEYRSQYFKFPFPDQLVFLYPLIPSLSGLVIGVETLLRERSRKGRWTFNGYRLIFLALPALLFCVYPYMPWKMEWLPKGVVYLLLTSAQINVISGVLFGYFVITSLEKRDTGITYLEKERKI
ncbi:hypothetical protein [Paenibacillus durus]|uniref:hypothetical protein n=1 Tax=Paenibacillus durus TaxID=44251 RepID=UPI00146FE1E9|nr:hypothetical protein [Paenibacillus durus]